MASVSRLRHGPWRTLGRSELLDDRLDYDEERIQSLCIDQGTVLFVVTVMPDENVC
jgi:hypothetical protein